MAFNDRLREARKQRGLTQEQAGKLLGSSKSTVSGYELGTSDPDVAKINQMIQLYGVDANYLWQDEMSAAECDFAPTDAEHQMILKHRALDEHGKNIIDLLLDAEFRRVKQMQRPEDIDWEQASGEELLAEVDRVVVEQYGYNPALESKKPSSGD